MLYRIVHTFFIRTNFIYIYNTQTYSLINSYGGTILYRQTNILCRPLLNKEQFQLIKSFNLYCHDLSLSFFFSLKIRTS